MDHARARHYQERGGLAGHVTFDEALAVTSEPDQGFAALADALKTLAAFDERKGRSARWRRTAVVEIGGDEPAAVWIAS